MQLKSDVTPRELYYVALALALVFLLGGCGFALFRAFVGGMASGAVGSPALLMF